MIPTRCSRSARPTRAPQSSQNRRLVQTRQRSRTIFAPHSEQKIWTIICEERQSVRIIANSRKKQPLGWQKRPKSARLKNSGRAGILCRPISMRYRKPLCQTFIFAFFAFVALVPARAQDVDDVIRTETSLIQLNVGVVDKQGRAITSLTRDDFTIYEDGVKQSIQHFEPVDAPFSLVLMLDMSGSTINFRQQLKLASQRFLDALAPEDRVAVVQFNKDVKSLTGFS